MLTVYIIYIEKNSHRRKIRISRQNFNQQTSIDMSKLILIDASKTGLCRYRARDVMVFFLNSLTFNSIFTNPLFTFT